MLTLKCKPLLRGLLEVEVWNFNSYLKIVVKLLRNCIKVFFFFSFWLPIKFVLVLTFDVCSCMVNWGVYTLLLFGNWINKCIVVLAIWELFSVDYTRKYFLWFYFIFVGSPLYCLSWKLDKKKGKKGLIHGLLKLSWRKG